MMPIISIFYGIMIRMYWRDHPPPHFHAVYGAYDAMISIETGKVLKGSFPPTAAKIVRDWTIAHRSELMDNWSRIQVGELPRRIGGPDAD